MQHTQLGHSETYPSTLSTFLETQKEISLETMMEMLQGKYQTVTSSKPHCAELKSKNSYVNWDAWPFSQ